MNWKKFLLGNFDYTKTTKNGKYNVKINIQVGILPTIVIIVLIAWLIIKQEINAGMKIVIQTTKGTIESPEFPEIVREPLKEKIDKLADDLMDSWFNHPVYFRVDGWACILNKKEFMSITLTDQIEWNLRKIGGVSYERRNSKRILFKTIQT